MPKILKEFAHLRVKLDALTLATTEDKKIGEGGFGPVYKGELVSGEHTHTVAVKCLNTLKGQGDAEFFKEIVMLSAYKHENIISLLGFCDEKGTKMLVYEYASKESLDKHLRSNELTWALRLKICIGAARGLAYLHDPAGGHKRLLHRDIKSPNILLDENWNAKIADFGLSKFGPANQNYSVIFTNHQNVAGTVGYVDPQYMESGMLTKESDVYSFGVVLFEVLCGRLSINSSDRSQSLTNLVRRNYKRKKLNDMVWCNIRDEIHPSSLKSFTTIAYQCFDTDYEMRPLMKKIVRALETCLEYQSTADKTSSLVEEFKHLRIGIESIKHATNNFGVDNYIAEGGCGKVYRGEFVDSKVQRAVKRLDCKNDHAADLLLWREIMLLTSYTHQNIVSLRGFCDESEEKIIVYECAINKTLDLFLNDPKFTWIQRLKACLGVAYGLEYLHDHKDSVLHGHIRSANILLDQKWNAYLTNFGLSRYGHANEEHMLLFSDEKAILGCFDPIYQYTGLLTKKSDIYSFGVVLFEVLLSRPCVDNNYDDEHQYIPKLVKHYREQRKDIVVDANLRLQIEEKCFETFVTLAYQCLESHLSQQPSMNMVVSTLRRALEYQEAFEAKAEEAKAKANPLLDFEKICPPGGSDLIILYTTSVKGIRKTFKDCSTIRSLLKSLKVLYQERDISMHLNFKDELVNILGKPMPLPRLYIKGRYIGGAEEILRLHEQGKFRPLLADMPLNISEGPCQTCAGARSVVCRKCNGSNIVKHGRGVQTRCRECNKNGLIKCPICF